MEMVLKENLYMRDCIRTYSGKYMNVFDPKPEMVCIEDIAHALSMQPRFGGHLPVFYSVAQHSVLTSCIAIKDKYEALMHDISEAYLIDVPRPIKLGLPNYKEIENNLMEMLAGIFEFEYPLSEYVKRADEEMLQIEWDDLMLVKGSPWIAECWSQERAKEEFIKRYKELQ